MKKYMSILALLAVLVSGCNNNDELEKQSASSSSRVFTASFHSDESRTYVEEGNLLRWTEGDQISLFDGNTLNRQYKFDGKTGANAGTFSLVEKPYGTGNSLNTANYAVYPYASNISITESGVITATLPAEQNYSVNSFGLGDNTMVAVTEGKEDTFLKFKNVGGYLKLQLYGDDVTVKSITLTGNNNEKLAGTATITSSYGDDPIVSMSADATKTIMLDCGEGVKLGTTTETATAFWLVLPETTFERGFTVVVTDVNGAKFTKSTSKNIFIERNYIMSMTAFEVEVESEDIPYLTFSAEAAQKLTMSKAVATLEYSVNGGEWKELGTNTVEFGGELGDLRIRGKSEIGTGSNYTDHSRISFLNKVEVSCSGDIRTLIDYDNYMEAKTTNASFFMLFQSCYWLVSAPELPATELADCCYYSMFNGCVKLLQAPELPAIKLAKECYFHMFGSCISLTKVPDLPATILAERCYGYMFEGCTKLLQAPDLPAITLADYSYSGMFQNCTSLTKVSLPAINLSKGCYEAMFFNCTNLMQAPALPAYNLAESCYEAMFENCTNLVQTSELSAVILAKDCCHSMYKGCINLKQISDLPATVLSESCYADMFSNCTSLTNAPRLSATVLADWCYAGMFSGCTNLMSIPELPAIKLAWCCYHYMFHNCTSLTKAPRLSATILAESCYYGMFEGCGQLNDITMLATNIKAYGCLTNWLSGVSLTGTFTKAEEMESLPTGSNGIPEGWTIKNYGEE